MFSMKSNISRALLCSSLGVLFTFPVGATIIGGTVTGGSAFTNGGTFVKLPIPIGNPFGAPNSVGNDTFQSFNLFGFDEAQNALVTGIALATDVGTSPIAVGTVVASHYIFFDPRDSASIDGTVDFDSNIIAIITSTGTLALSDYLANTGVNYLNPGLRGLEAGDFVTIDRPRRIRFNTSASSPGDYVRVLTEFSPTAVPEPGAGLMIAGGVGMLMFLRRRSGK